MRLSNNIYENKFDEQKIPEFCDFGVKDGLTQAACKYPHNCISSFHLPT